MPDRSGECWSSLYARLVYKYSVLDDNGNTWPFIWVIRYVSCGVVENWVVFSGRSGEVRNQQLSASFLAIQLV